MRMGLSFFFIHCVHSPGGSFRQQQLWLREYAFVIPSKTPSLPVSVPAFWISYQPIFSYVFCPFAFSLCILGDSLNFQPVYGSYYFDSHMVMFQEPFLSVMGKLRKPREALSGYLWEQVGSCGWAVLHTEVPSRQCPSRLHVPSGQTPKRQKSRVMFPAPFTPRSSKTDRRRFSFRSVGQVVGF